MYRSNPYARMLAIGVGTVIVFGLQQGLEQPLYVAVPVAIVGYAATLALAWMLGARPE